MSNTKMPATLAQTIARTFKRERIDTGMQWDATTLDGYLFRDGWSIDREPNGDDIRTLKNLAHFIRANARPATVRP